MSTTRESVLAALNGSGLASQMGIIKEKLLKLTLNSLFSADKPDPENKVISDTSMLLDMMGPAAASAAVEFSISSLRAQGKLQRHQFSDSHVHNYRLLANAARQSKDLASKPTSNGHPTVNEPMEEFQGFTSVLRQFLLPRYAYLDFDLIVDPRHRLDYECGYPKFITPIMYRYLYDRDDVAKRVVDFYANESWIADPEVYETEDEKNITPFEQDYYDLCDAYNLKQYLYRIDRLCGIGHYGALLLMVDDGRDLEAPIDEPRLLAGQRRSVARKRRNLLAMRPFDEYLSFIHQYETDVMHPRYGLPKFYNLVFLDMTIDAAGASIGTRLNRRVHWTRVIHVAPEYMSSLVFGIPRMQPVFNRLLDLRKIKGGSAEMFWKGAFPGIAFEIDPSLTIDEPEFNKEEFRRELQDYTDGMTRMLTLLGVKAHSLEINVADPRNHVHVQMEAIAMAMDVPARKWLGSEEAKLASAADMLTWNQRLGRHIRMHTEPNVVRNALDRFVAIGVMAPPQTGRYYVGWDDLNKPTDEDKANLALKWTQALSQYVASGVIHLIPPEDYLPTVLGLRPSDAMKIIEHARSQGGFEKLYKVDPSEAAGVNGKARDQVGDTQKSKMG
jgi:uncharacterized protein